MMMYPKETVNKATLLARLDMYQPPDGFEQITTRFANCVFYKGALGGKKFSVKVFSDASMHVTGVTTEEHLTDIADTFFSFVGAVAGVELNLSHVKMQLLSSTFKITKDVLIDKLGELLVGEPGVDVHRDNQRHRGLKVSFLQDEPVENKVKRKNHKATAFVFRTGSVVLTGGTKLAYLLEAYYLLMELLNKHKAEVCIEHAPKRVPGKRKRGGDWESALDDIAASIDAGQM